MKSLAEQISNKCTHFNGLGDDGKSCRAGVVYLTVMSRDPASKGFCRYPCFREGEGIPCDKRHFPTADEVAAEVAEHEEGWEQLELGINAATEDAKKQGFKRGNGGMGVVPCPVCKTGDLHYSVSGYNGHMHGRCSTNGCVSWMQ